jgi:hypothetical protein
MATDGTQIKTDIDTNLANKGYRGVYVFQIITALKKVVDWVTGAVNGNLSTWLRTSDNQPGGTNSDGVYRTGYVQFRGGAFALTQTPNANTLAQTAVGTNSGLQVQGTNAGPAYIEFHLPGIRIDQLGVDTDGVMKYRPWGASVSYELAINGFVQKLATSNALANRKLVLYDNSNNDHEFFGLGIQAGQLRHQVSSLADAHVFYAGTSPATSVELMRIMGSGLADFAYNGRFKGNTTAGAGAGVEISFGAIANSGTIICYDRTAGAYKDLYFDGATIYINAGNGGKVAIGTLAATSSLHIKATNGHQQLRLETSYTPTSTSDANGALGQISWDTNYFYVKTSAGWKRTALTTF